MSTPRHAPAGTQTPAVVPGAGRQDPPARPEDSPGRAPVPVAGADRLAPSAAQVARLRRVAAGDEDADLVVRGGLVVVVHDQTMLERDILVVGRYIAAVTKPGALGGRRSLDAEGRHVLPAYVEVGLRIEDTLLGPGELARLLVPQGTGTLLADPTAFVAFGGPTGVEFATGSMTPLRVLTRADGASERADGEIRTVTELAARGHLDHEAHRGVERAASSLEEVGRRTLGPARRYGLDHVLGSLTPTRLADLQVVSDLAAAVPPDVVMVGGRIAAESGRPLFDNLDPVPDWAIGRIRLPENLHAGSFPCPVPDSAGPGQDGSVAAVSIARVGDGAVGNGALGGGPAGVAPVGIQAFGAGMLGAGALGATAEPSPAARHGLRIARLVPTARGGLPVADPSRDLQKVAVFGRPQDAVPVEVGLVRGCGLVRGALGFTTAQAPGQLIVIGASDDDMLTAARAVEGMGGGFVVVDQGWVRAACPLPLLGLMSDAPWEAVLGELAAVDAAAADLGCRLPLPLRTLAGFGCLLHTRP
ncbi:adenine deaminase [Frankia sp. AiPa1]|nr:adenine deaminase [Frankia sp. AiPa1]